ncbi:hypothetical protein EWM75_25025 [Escherichia coli]|nr:hypothetical protein [Escherichia coli]EEY7959311.1 hypothetical protein [Escherichia coli]EFB1318692.1 hypothetical protein [Escherichia coli]EFB2354271.1 hypothetical protein [Escherichia coli]EFF9624350.1 hypothetical protein [Escherichia coli]
MVLLHAVFARMGRPHENADSRCILKLQRLLGKKTMEVEILKEAVEYGQSRKWIVRCTGNSGHYHLFFF